MLAGPQAKDSVSIFKGWSIRKILEEEFGILLSLSCVYLVLRRLELARIKPRPQHEKNDPEKIHQWLTKKLPDAYGQVIKNHPNKKIEI